MIVRLISGEGDIESARAIPWRSEYGELPTEAAACAAAAADLVGMETSQARHGAQVLVWHAGRWQAGRALLPSACRPRLPEGAHRVSKCLRLDAATAAALDAEAKRTGESQGQVVDRLVRDALPAVQP